MTQQEIDNAQVIPALIDSRMRPNSDSILINMATVLGGYGIIQNNPRQLQTTEEFATVNGYYKKVVDGQKAGLIMEETANFDLKRMDGQTLPYDTKNAQNRNVMLASSGLGYSYFTNTNLPYLQKMREKAYGITP